MGACTIVEEIENLVVAVGGGTPVRIRDFARVERGPEPVFNVVTADGVNAVLLNVRSQPDGSTLEIADALQEELADAAARAAAGHEAGVLLRPVAARARVGAAACGRPSSSA